MKKFYALTIALCLICSLAYAEGRVFVDTAANFTANHTILPNGDIGYESDSGRMKVGNGGKGWAELNYVTISSFSSTGTSTVGTLWVTTLVNPGSATIGTLSAVGITSLSTTTAANFYTAGTITANVVSSATFSLNHGACFKTSGQVGFCSDTVGATGTCTCN